MSSHSIHFPPAPKDEAPPKRHATNPAAKPKAEPVNIMECFGNALRDVELARERLRSLITSANRHGDLQVCLSAAKRLQDSLTALIEAEENH